MSRTEGLEPNRTGRHDPYSEAALGAAQTVGHATSDSFWQASLALTLRSRPGAVLDVCPKSTDFLEIMQNCGWSGTAAPGWDLSPGHVEGKINLITAWNMLGTCVDPEAFCARAFRDLSPGGVLLVSQVFASDDALDTSVLKAHFEGLHWPFATVEVHSASGPMAVVWARRAGHLTDRDRALRDWLVDSINGQRSVYAEHILLSAQFGKVSGPQLRAVSRIPLGVANAVACAYTQGDEAGLTALGEIPSIALAWERIVRRLMLELHRTDVQHIEQELLEIHQSFLWIYGVPLVGKLQQLLPSFVKFRVFPLMKKWRQTDRRDRWAAVRAWLLIRVKAIAPRTFRIMVPPPVRERIRAWMTPRYPTVAQQPWDDTVPLVSVIIPCFNYGAYLNEAIASVDGQTLGNVELIVVDDGSTDLLTRQVLWQLAESRPDIRVVSQPNAGLPAARNTGIRHARGKYISCLDADDLFEATYLEKAVAVLECRPDVGLAYSWVQLFGDEQTVWHTQPFDPRALLLRNFVAVSAVFRREHWVTVGGYNEKMTIGYEDWDFWLRVSATGCSGVVIPEPLLRHRRHGHTMTHRARTQHGELARAIREQHEVPVSRVAAQRRLEVTSEEAFINLCGRPKTRRRLLLVLPWMEVGGSEQVVLQILDGFKRSERWEIFVVTTLPSNNAWSWRFREVAPLVYVLPDLLPEHLARAYLLRFISIHMIDTVLISHSALAYDLCSEWQASRPSPAIVDVLHNDISEGYLATSAKQDPHITSHFVISEHIGASLLKVGVASDKIICIMNGVREDIFFPDRTQGDAWAAARGLGRRPRVGFVGRLAPEKDPELFARLAVRLSHCDAEWIMVGDGPLAERVEAIAHPIGRRFKMLGQRNDVAEAMRSLDVLVMTSRGEGAPLVVIEALLSGVPVVATDVGVMKDIIVTGVTGYVVRIGDEAALVRTMESLLSDPAKLRALQQVCCASRDPEQFSGRVMADSYVKQIESLIDKVTRDDPPRRR